MARSRQWSSSGESEWEGQFRVYANRLKRNAAAVARDVAAYAAEDMRTTIRTSGTGWENREGRIKSGEMLGAVDASKTATHGTTRGGTASFLTRFGYLHNWQDYYEYQDLGFYNVRKRNPSADGAQPPMTLGTNAYYQAYVKGREYLRVRLADVNFR